MTREITQEMLERAMKKAVEVGLISKTAPLDIYEKTWEGMRQVLEAAIGSKDREQTIRGHMVDCLAKLEPGAGRLIGRRGDDEPLLSVEVNDIGGVSGIRSGKKQVAIEFKNTHYLTLDDWDAQDWERR